MVHCHAFFASVGSATTSVKKAAYESQKGGAGETLLFSTPFDPLLPWQAVLQSWFDFPKRSRAIFWGTATARVHGSLGLRTAASWLLATAAADRGVIRVADRNINAFSFAHENSAPKLRVREKQRRTKP